MCDMTDLYVCHELIHSASVADVGACDVTYVRHDSFGCVAWHLYMGVKTHLYECSVSDVGACDVTCVRHDSFKCVIWHLYMGATNSSIRVRSVSDVGVCDVT